MSRPPLPRVPPETAVQKGRLAEDAGNRIAVRFAHAWHDDSDPWFCSNGHPGRTELGL